MRLRPLALVLAAMPASLVAQSPAPDAQAGRALALSTCAACHGANGVSVAPHIPNLAAQSPAYLAAQIEAFRDGSRKSEVMTPIAQGLDPKQVPGVTAYYASLSGAAPGARSSPLPALATRVTFPADYPAAYTRYHAIESPEQGRVTVYLANAAAREAAKAGKPLPAGSVVMTVTHEIERDAKGAPKRSDKGELVPARAIAYALMASGAGWGETVPELVRNGDWHYALLDGEKRPRAGVNHAECLACHKPKAASSYVFTLGKLAGQ